MPRAEGRAGLRARAGEEAEETRAGDRALLMREGLMREGEGPRLRLGRTTGGVEARSGGGGDGDGAATRMGGREFIPRGDEKASLVLEAVV